MRNPAFLSADYEGGPIRSTTFEGIAGRIQRLYWQAREINSDLNLIHAIAYRTRAEEDLDRTITLLRDQVDYLERMRDEIKAKRDEKV